MTEQPKSLSIDVAKYEAYLADCDLTDPEKEQFLLALWDVVIAFVDLGFSVHSLDNPAENQTFEPQDVVHLNHVPKSDNTEAAHE